MIVATVFVALFSTTALKGEQSASAVPPSTKRQTIAPLAPLAVAEKDIEIKQELPTVKPFNKDDPTTYPTCKENEVVNTDTGSCDIRPVEEPEPTPVQTVVMGKGAAYSENTYTWGNCTWYAKNRRPDLPNTLGNADTWYYYAKEQGLSVGSEPRVGAIGQEKGVMHVVYVEGINTDGTINISEMNVLGLNVVSSRNVLASNFNYIY